MTGLWGRSDGRSTSLSESDSNASLLSASAFRQDSFILVQCCEGHKTQDIAWTLKELNGVQFLPLGTPMSSTLGN